MSNTESDPEELALGGTPPSCSNGARVEIITSRAVPLGGPRAMTVNRTLPQRKRSLIGPFCFLDHYGPDEVSTTGGMDVAPHPHTGLQTVSWLFEGEITHHDSGNNHAVVIPGEVNLMTAGAGICHSEVSTQSTKRLHGVQLWTVLPDEHRFGPRRFDHFAPPATHIDGGEALVFIGSAFGATSTIPTFTPLVALELRIEPLSTVTMELNPDFEHGYLVDSGDIDIEGVSIEPTALAYTGINESRVRIRNSGKDLARLIIIGGEPFTEDVVMWWNFIGRDHDEIEQFRSEWESHGKRFGETKGYIAHNPDALDRLPAPALPNARIRPRINPSPVARPD